MDRLKKLPDAEFDIMKAVWANEPPVTTSMLMGQLGKEWKAQTLLSLLSRLVERGFLRTEKNGKERTYYALIGREEYLSFETGHFMRNFHNNSISGFMTALFGDKNVDADELDEIKAWLKERK